MTILYREVKECRVPLNAGVYAKWVSREMVSNQNGVDIDEVMRNAKAEGVLLSEITLVYCGLTDQEKEVMRQAGVIRIDKGDTVMGAFNKSGIALFTYKISMVLYLAA